MTISEIPKSIGITLGTMCFTAIGAAACHNVGTDEPICVYPTLGEPPEACKEALAHMDDQLSKDAELSYCYNAVTRSREVFACKEELQAGAFAKNCAGAGLDPEATNIESLDEQLDLLSAASMNCTYLIQIDDPIEGDNP